MSRTIQSVLPANRDLYYGGRWQAPHGGYADVFNPSTGESLGPVAQADLEDVEAVIAAARAGFEDWQGTLPKKRSAVLREIAGVIRANAEELALLDAANCGNPVTALLRDAENAATKLDYFAGVALEAKGSTIPAGQDMMCMTVREPWGVCLRIGAFNHPLSFAGGKLGAPLAAGNSVIMKPSPQAPLSALRLAELIEGIAPPGVINFVTCGLEATQALVGHRDVAMVSIVGSIATGRAVAKACADRLKPMICELSGKNALIAYPDADVHRTIEGAVRGMNFTWCGQSCGSTSRLFVHADIHDAVVEGVIAATRRFKPGLATDPATNMGAIISKAQYEKIMNYIDLGRRQGATLRLGGARPSTPELANGYFIEPTIFTDVTPDMAIAHEEIFGPVLAVIKWTDEADMMRHVNSVDYGLTAAIYTTNVTTAHRTARQLQSGFVWVNDTSSHYIGAPFGGYKLSGVGREESIEELLEFTQVKTIKIAL
ncbi:aldehyde dehydrogenase family protein [Shinella sp. S4-D37]|uniref:aldehyde dehydrogenase family protein n=1 Tax=Shinella sp. S4-D37 TaxID=3161999 RepID=UPI003464EE23